MNENERELVDKIVAQKELCRKMEVPNFAPMDGICFSCHKQIYEGITVAKAGAEHITGCHFCNRSFCD